MSKTENECIVMGMSARADRLIGDAMRSEKNGIAYRSHGASVFLTIMEFHHEHSQTLS
jgi:hypothetical protein